MHELSVHWVDRGVEPKCPPDPRFPYGMDINGAQKGERSCFTKLPYPARRCGYYLVGCDACEQTVMITTAGRPDDPRSVRIPCRDHAMSAKIASV